MSTPNQRGYRPDIEGLRAVAVLLVVVFHFHLVAGVDSGFMGVDVFFVISGFLITSIIRRQLADGSFRLGTFWGQRVRRLAPALVATTLITLAVGWATLLPIEFAKLAQQTLVAQLYVANIWFWRNVNYFGLQSQDVYLLHTWSLAVEEQFYIVFPLLLLALHRWLRSRVAWALALAAVASFAINLAFVHAKPEATFYLMPTRAWELLAGSLLSLFLARGRPVSRAAAECSGAVGVACLVVAIVGYRPEYPFPGVFAIVPTLAAVALIHAGSAPNATVPRWLGRRPWTDIGRISYPLYLVHWPINVFAAGHFRDGYTWGWRFAMLVLSIALAAVVYRGVEVPVRRWLDGIRLRSVTAAYGIALGGIVAMSVAVVASGGVPSRYDPEVVRLAAYANDTPPPLSECQYVSGARLQVDRLCRLGVPQVAPTWLVYGDSHAWAASGAIDLWLRRRGEAASFVFVHSCPPLVGVHLFRGGETCFDLNNAVLAYLNEPASPANVFLISTWVQAKEGLLTTSASRQPTQAESIALFTRQFEATVDALVRLQKNVYVWEPVPGAHGRVPQTMVHNRLSADRVVLEPSRDSYTAWHAYFFDALARRKSVLKGSFSPSAALCASGTCRTDIDGVPVYFDNGHLAYSLRSFWAEALARQLDATP